MPSLSAGEVKVEKPSSVVNNTDLPEIHLPWEGSLRAQELDAPLGGLPEPTSPSQMEEDSVLLSSCQAATSMPAPQHYDNGDSSMAGFGDDLQDSGTGPRNLQTKRIMAAPTMPDPHQCSCENSLSDRVGDVLQDTASGPLNLRANRIMVVWRNRVEDCGPISAKHLGNRMEEAGQSQC